MSQREEFVERVQIGNAVYEFTLLEHPTVDDLVISQAKSTAAGWNVVNDTPYRVSRAFRDYLVRLGVER